MKKRTFKIDVGCIRSKEERTVEATLSSEYPVKRWDGEEVLSHKPECVDLSRAPLPLITSHEQKRLPVGIVENLKLIGGKLKGILKISSTQNEIWQDIKDGILRNLSIGYFVKERKKTKNGYLVTRWQPYECSLVAAAADPLAGIGRSIIRKESITMDYNDILKAKKRALDEMHELAMTENLSDVEFEKFNGLKDQVRIYDQRLEMMDAVREGKKNLKDNRFNPELDRRQDRSILNFEGGPVHDRSYVGMFNQGRELVVDEEEVKRFRAQMVEGVSSSGGFAVPDPLAAKWLDDSLPDEIIRPLATVWPMTSATRKVPGWDGPDQSGGEYFGGFEMQMLAETGTGTKQTGKLRLIQLTAWKGAIFVDISNELKEDGQGFESQLEMAIKKSMGLGMDYHFIQGTGAGQAIGILNADSLISVTKESGQNADTIVMENIVKMFARMYPAGRSKAVWLANETCIPELMTLSFDVGTGGSHYNVFSERDGKFRLLGRPIYFTPFMPPVGDANDISFVDLSQYAIGIRRDMRLEKSNIPGWTQDLMSYRVLVRFDGMPTWETYITPRNGDTLSWCVGLGERA